MSGVSYGLSAQVQELSAHVFGQRHRLALMAAIAQSEDGIVNPGQLAAELGFRAQSSIQAPLKSLLDSGLVTRISGLEGRVYYRREDSHAWVFALELLSRALAADVAQTR